MTVTTDQPLPMILDEVEVISVERLSPTLRPGRAGRRRPGRLRRRRARCYDQRIKLVFPNDAGGLPSLRGRRRVLVRRPGSTSPRPSAGTCAPTPCATCAAPASTPGWSSTSCCTSTTARPDPGSGLGGAGRGR